MPEGIRTYNALVGIDDPNVLSRFIGKMLSEKETIALKLDVIGIEVTDSYASLSFSKPFAGRNKPKLDPESPVLSWQNTDETELSINMGSKRLPSQESIRIRKGIVHVAPIRLLGNKHPEFNHTFKDGSATEVPFLSFLTDRVEACYDRRATNQRRSNSILPLLGRIPLLRVPLEE